MSRFALQFPASEIRALAERNADPADPEIERIGTAARERGHFTRDELLRVVEWKSQKRQLHNAIKNDEERVIEATAVALGARSEQLRMSALISLDGVSWPTASVMLHFAHAEPYPILDVRALQSLGIQGAARYTLDFWIDYVRTCRALAEQNEVTMRELDRALWLWSKEQGVVLRSARRGALRH